MNLDAYLEAAAAEPWRWGAMDCTLFAANWVRARHGVDPAARWRGRYSTAEEAKALLKEEGGLRFLVREGMEALGFRETNDPKDGDVGIIVAPVRHQSELPVCGTIGAIRRGGFWIARGVRGVRGGAFEHLTAWAV